MATVPIPLWISIIFRYSDEALLSPSFHSGYADAQVALGIMYAEGRGVPEDHTEAVAWFRKAAEKGNARAQHNLGLMHFYGRGVPEDDVEAHAWFNIAAAQGHTPAAEVKDRVAQQMTPDARDRAQKLAKKYWKEYVLPFRN